MAATQTTAKPNQVVRLGRWIRRRWRRFKRRWLAPQVRFVYHDAYAMTLEGAPVDPARGRKILGFLIDEGLLDRDDISVATSLPPCVVSGEPLLLWVAD